MNRVLEKRKINILEYVKNFLQRRGAVVEIPSFAFMEVLLPGELQPHFGGEEFLPLAFHPEVAEEEEVPLVIPGSPILDIINSLILKEEKVLRRHILVDSTARPNHLPEKIQHDFTFNKCRPPQITGHRLEEHHYLVFIFHISLISDERVEHMEPIPIDTHLNLPQLEIATSLEKAFYQQQPETILPIPPRKDLCQIIPAAQKKVEEVTCLHKKNLEKRLHPFKQDELEKMQAFYEQTERELRQKLSRLEDIPKNEKKKENLLSKLRSNEIDQERRRADIQEKFSIKSHIKLSALLHYSLPKIRIFLNLQKRQNTILYQILYNPLSQELERPLCQVCGTQMKEIFFTGKKGVCSSCKEEGDERE